ncbi:MAG: pentapeptide repeat-containing protein [Phormidesmis sp.]
MDTEDFLKQFTPRNKTTGFDLSKTNLRKQELAFLDLSMNLRGSDLSDAVLESVEWNGIDLTGANLSGAFCEGANLIGADLRNADLSNARFGRVNFERTCLDGANLTNA